MVLSQAVGGDHTPDTRKIRWHELPFQKCCVHRMYIDIGAYRFTPKLVGWRRCQFPRADTLDNVIVHLCLINKLCTLSGTDPNSPTEALTILKRGLIKRQSFGGGHEKKEEKRNSRTSVKVSSQIWSVFNHFRSIKEHFGGEFSADQRIWKRARYAVFGRLSVSRPFMHAGGCVEKKKKKKSSQKTPKIHST